MNACKILYEKAREFNREAEALRARAAELDAKADTMNAAAKELDPWYLTQVIGADGTPRTLALHEIGAPLM